MKYSCARHILILCSPPCLLPPLRFPLPREVTSRTRKHLSYFLQLYFSKCLRAPTNITRQHFSWDNYTSFLLKGYLLHTWSYFLRYYSYRTEKYNRNKNDRRQKDCHITMRRIRQFPTPCIMLGGAVQRGDRLCPVPLSKEKLFFVLLLLYYPLYSPHPVSI